MIQIIFEVSLTTSYLADRQQYVKIGQHSSTTRKLDLGVPQGSVLDPMLFTAYVSPVGDVITSMGLKHHQYTDDTQLYFAVRASHYKDDLNIIEKCTSSVQDWFLVNDLLLNPTKSEVIAVETATQRRTTISAGTVAIAGAPLSFVDNIRSLSVQINSDLFLMRKSNQFADRVTITPEICDRSVTICRPILLRLACAIVGSRLDYCNSVHNISNKNIQKLQRIQNNLAHVILKALRLTSPEPMLASLHWLPVVDRIQYKLAIITFKALTTGQPTYLADLLHRCVAVRHMHSSTPDSLVVPSIRTKMASRAFSHAAPTIWNILPHDVRETTSINSFRTRLKNILLQVSLLTINWMFRCLWVPGCTGILI